MYSDARCRLLLHSTVLLCVCTIQGVPQLYLSFYRLRVLPNASVISVSCLPRFTGGGEAGAEVSSPTGALEELLFRRAALLSFLPLPLCLLLPFFAVDDLADLADLEDLPDPTDDTECRDVLELRRWPRSASLTRPWPIPTLPRPLLRAYWMPSITSALISIQ